MDSSEAGSFRRPSFRSSGVMSPYHTDHETNDEADTASLLGRSFRDHAAISSAFEDEDDEDFMHICAH
jgi:hypothetical protein